MVGAALVVRLIDEWWSYLPAGAVDDLHRDLGISYTGAGWLLALLTIGAVIGTPIALLADHVDRRRCAVLGAADHRRLSARVCRRPRRSGCWRVSTACVGTASDLLVHAVEASLSEADDVRLDRMVAAAARTVDDRRPRRTAAAGRRRRHGARLAGQPSPSPPWSSPSTPATCGWSRSPRRSTRPTSWRAIVGDAVRIARRPRRVAPRRDRDARRPVGRAVHRLRGRPRRGRTGRSGRSAQALAVATMLGGVVGSVAVARLGLRPGVQRAGLATMLVGTVLAAASSAWLAAAAAMVAVGVGMAVVWADVHMRTLRTVPGRSATVSVVVGTLGSASSAGAGARRCPRRRRRPPAGLDGLRRRRRTARHRRAAPPRNGRRGIPGSRRERPLASCAERALRRLVLLIVPRRRRRRHPRAPPPPAPHR